MEILSVQFIVLLFRLSCSSLTIRSLVPIPRDLDVVYTLMYYSSSRAFVPSFLLSFEG
jgi:hypothetical protein